MGYTVSKQVAQTLLDESTHPFSWGIQDPEYRPDPVWVIPIGSVEVIGSDATHADLALICSAPDLARTVVELHTINECMSAELQLMKRKLGIMEMEYAKCRSK
jgi:hypothetical protein